MKEQELALENLRHRILEEPGQADQALWTAVIAFQGFPFYTASGLPFWYTLKRSGSGCGYRMGGAKRRIPYRRYSF